MQIIFTDFTSEIEKCKKINSKIKLVISTESLFTCYFGIMYNYYFIIALVFSLIGFISFKNYDKVAIRLYIMYIIIINVLRGFFIINNAVNNKISYILKISLVIFIICTVLNLYILIITLKFYQLLNKLDKASLIFLKNNE